MEDSPGPGSARNMNSCPFSNSQTPLSIDLGEIEMSP